MGTELIPPYLGSRTVPTISSSVRIREYSYVVCIFIFRGTVMCYQGRK